MSRIRIPPATLARLPCRDMPIAIRAVPNTVMMEAVLTPSCPRIIKIRKARMLISRTESRNLVSPASALRRRRALSSILCISRMICLPTR